MTKDTTAPRRRRTPLLVAAALLAAAPAIAGDTRPATLQAIHLLENPYDLSAPGPCGELGAYQFRASTWRRYSSEPFARALDRRASDAVAIRHYDWLKQGLKSHGIEVTPYNIALAWNGGLTAAVSGRTSAAARDYAERAANLAESFDGSVAVR